MILPSIIAEIEDVGRYTDEELIAAFMADGESREDAEDMVLLLRQGPPGDMRLL